MITRKLNCHNYLLRWKKNYIYTDTSLILLLDKSRFQDSLMQDLFQRCSNQKTISRWQVQSSYARPETFHKLAKDYLQYKSKSKFQYVRSNFQDIPDKAFFFTPFDKFKVQRQTYFRRVQVQTNLLLDKFKEEFQDKVISSKKSSKIRWLTNIKWQDSWQSKLLSTRKSVRFQIFLTIYIHVLEFFEFEDV